MALSAQASFDFHITHTPIGPIAQPLSHSHTHTDSWASVNQTWISRRCKWRNCQSQEWAWVEISRSHLKARARERESEGAQLTDSRIRGKRCQSAAQTKRSGKKTRKRETTGEKRGKAFHLRIYLEFENLMRWADGQIMLCKWYVHKSQTDSVNRPDWQRRLFVLPLPLPLPVLLLHRIRCSAGNDWQFSHVKPVRKMNRLTIDKRNAWQVHAQHRFGVGGSSCYLHMLGVKCCHAHAATHTLSLPFSLSAYGSICVCCVFPKLQRNCVPDLPVNAGSVLFLPKAESEFW